MRAMVFGASGFLGSAISAHLAGEGWEVVTVSRSGTSPHGRSLRGDVTLPDFGLSSADLGDLTSSVTHIVSCFGSVDWTAGPQTAVDLHYAGTQNVLRFGHACRGLERVVHVSSILALGRARGTVGNRDLYLNQRFRNWYEYGKYLAERCTREAGDLPRRSVRLGPLLGVGESGPPDVRHGLLAVLPLLLRGYPIHLAGGGDFPCYVGEVHAAAAVVFQALTTAGEEDLTWTWYDPRRPSLAEVLIQLCQPWGLYPRIADARLLNSLLAVGGARRLGAPRGMTAYTQPWMTIDERVLDALPGGSAIFEADYIGATGEAIRDAIHRGDGAGMPSRAHLHAR
jgi:nucleoside-diphosphate-sugar epimerase